MSLFKKEEPQQYQSKGNPVRCLMCKHDYFYVRKSQLNTRVASFFNLDWTNKEATCYVCADCGYIHWFLT